MSRIFLGLASLNALALLFSFVLGFLCEGRAHVGKGVPLTPSQAMFTAHLLSGLLAALLTLLVHCLTLTYFMGTGRWVQEVVAAYRLPGALWNGARQIKSRTFPFILGSILLVIGSATLGAASDRGLVHPSLHLVLSLGAVGFNFWSYAVEYHALRMNGALLDQIMAEVTRIRSERGLVNR